MTWVYIKTEPRLWTVGFYGPDGKFETDSDHRNQEDAAKRVHWLNGGPKDYEPTGYTEGYDGDTEAKP